jgi:hypothetical protein
MLPHKMPGNHDHQQQQLQQPSTMDQGMEYLSAIGQRYFRLIEFDAKERLELEIRKHPIGLFLVFATGVFVILAIMIVTGALSFLARDGNLRATVSGDYAPAIVLVGFILSLLAGGIMAIGAFLYRSNVVFVTNQKIAQVLYITIFNRKISQLNIGDIQDVTVTQKGFLAHVFNYGTLVIETAGEQQNYTFTFVPDPYIAAKTIIGLHEKNIAQFGN